MPERDDDLLLADMISSAEAIFTYVGDYLFEDFLGDRKTTDAVIRNFEINWRSSKIDFRRTKVDK